MFHRSCATAGGRNKPVLVAVLGLKGWTTITVGDVTLPGTFLVLAVTVHDMKGLKVYLIGVHLSTSMCFFYSDILWDFHVNLEENRTRTEQHLWRTFIVFQKDGAVYQEQEIALCSGTVHTGSERAACWDVLHSGSWVSHRHCIAKVWSGNVCACVSLIWMLSLETLIPVPQQNDMDTHFQFSQPVVCGGGITFCLRMWSRTLCFVFSKSVTYVVNLFWQSM